MQTIQDIPEDVSTVQDLVLALNQRFDAINADLSGLSSSQNGQTPQLNPNTPTDTGSQEGNAFSYSNPDTNVYNFLDPLFASLRTAQILVSQAQVQVNSIGTAQIQLGAVTAQSIAANTIVAGNIAAGTITGTQIAASTITADKINVSNLAAISANLGTITAGNITLDSSGFIRGGQTAYNTGTGFWLGYASGTYEFSIGSSTQALLWNGTNLSIIGAIGATSGYLGASTNAITISSAGINVGTSGSIMGGQTGYNTGTGFFLGYSSGAYVLSLGVSSGNYLTWNGSTLAIKGTITASSGTIGGFTIGATTLSATGSGGAVSLDAGNGIVTMTKGSIAVNMYAFDPGTGAEGLFTIVNGIVTQASLGVVGGNAILELQNGSATPTVVLTGNTGIITLASGSASAPSYSFTGDGTTGMYWDNTPSLNLAAGGTRYFGLHSSKVVCYQALQLNNVYVASPPTATGYVTLLDFSGTTYKVLVST